MLPEAGESHNRVVGLHGTVVCGIGSAKDRDGATQLAAALASRLRLRLVLVHVATGSEPEGVRQELQALASELCVEAEVRVARGRPVDALAQIAAEEGADVIVLGSGPSAARGRQVRCRFAREVEAATSVPVLIAPPTTRERSTRRLALAKTLSGR